MRGFIGGMPVVLLAVAAQAKAFEQENNNNWLRPGATVIGGPSGNDGDGGFISPHLANIETDTQINEWSQDDHSVHLKHTEVEPRPVMVPVAFGSTGANGPRVPGPGPFERRSLPDHHSIGLNHENIYHPPPFRASALDRRSEEAGGPSPAGLPVKHFAPHPQPHPEPHYEPHPEPHFVNHPEPHYDSHYSSSYEPHYESESELENDLTMIKNVNNGPAAGSISFGRRPTK